MITKKKKPTRAAKPSKKIELDPASDEALRALDPKFAEPPDMPVAIAQGEFASLARLGRSFAAELAKVGIGADQVEALARLAKRLAVLQERWEAARSDVVMSKAEHKALAEAEALDAKFVAGGRWACRDDADAQVKLDRIVEGSGLADTLQDLRAELDFWKDRAEQLKFTDITAKDLKRAEELIVKLEGAAEKEDGDASAARTLGLRNRCFWAADRLAKLIREGGRYAFRLEPPVAAKFSGRYRTMAVRRSRNAARAKKQPRVDGAPGTSKPADSESPT